MPTIKMSELEWEKIFLNIKKDYSHKPSVFLIRNSMKTELGFVPRRHSGYDDHNNYTTQVHLDFYDDHAETLFRLKYS